jgi:muramoyltetrapeptide carboxypeptidase LdcA involved in peptidoglycan recycling
LDKAAQKLDRLGQLANMLTGEEYLENLREQNKVLGERITLSRKALNSDKFEQETAKRLDDLKQLFTKSDVADDANNIAAIFD